MQIKVYEIRTPSDMIAYLSYSAVYDGVCLIEVSTKNIAKFTTDEQIRVKNDVTTSLIVMWNRKKRDVVKGGAAVHYNSPKGT